MKVKAYLVINPFKSETSFLTSRFYHFLFGCKQPNVSHGIDLLQKIFWALNLIFNTISIWHLVVSNNTTCKEVNVSPGIDFLKINLQLSRWFVGKNNESVYFKPTFCFVLGVYFAVCFHINAAVCEHRLHDGEITRLSV